MKSIIAEFVELLDKRDMTNKYKCEFSHERSEKWSSQVCIGCLNAMYARHDRMLEFIKKIKTELARDVEFLNDEEYHLYKAADELLKEIGEL